MRISDDSEISLSLSARYYTRDAIACSLLLFVNDPGWKAAIQTEDNNDPGIYL